MMRHGKGSKNRQLDSVNSIHTEEAKVSRPSKRNTRAKWNASGVSIFALMLLFVIPIASAQAQAPGACSTLDAPPTGIAPPGDALRPGHLGRQVENEEEITHFYHDLIGLELRGNREQPRAFGQNRGLQEVASLVQGAPDPYQQASRVVLLPIPGTAAAAGGPEMTIESIEIKGIPTRPFHPALTDPGASYLKLIVTDLDKTLAVLKQERTPIITAGENPVDVPSWPGITGKIRAVFVRDPDGYPVELMQITPAPESTAAADSKVLGARVAIVVDNIEKTCGMYERLVGPDFKFWISPSLMGDAGYASLTGVHNQFRLAEALVPGSPVVMELIEYKGHSKHFQRPHFQDPGSAHFLFMSKDDDVMVDRVKAANLHTTSPSNAPVFISPTTRMFFVTDPQGFWIEFMDNGVKKDPDWPQK
jgi:catechol 2,3-dioxygenase-like lactoylglutathione lyase family enzyme